MHAIASYILSLFLSPFNWIIILIVAGFIFRKHALRKSCRIIALFIFIIFSNQWLLDLYAKNWQPAPYVIPANTVYSCGIVPGGFASPDVNAHGYFNATADRFIQVEELYKLGKIKNILISGGNGKENEKSFREGKWVKEQLVITGIPVAVIYVEDKSNNTADNAVYAKEIIDSLQLKPPYLLITSAHHVPRASLLFRKDGLTTVAYPCSYIAGRGDLNWWSFLPQFSILFTWETYLKETAAYYIYKLKGNL